MVDQTAVGSTAALAAPLRATEADDGRELGPVNRIKPAMLAADGHRPCDFLAEPVQSTAREERAKINTPPQPPKAPCTTLSAPVQGQTAATHRSRHRSAEPGCNVLQAQQPLDGGGQLVDVCATGPHVGQHRI